MQQFDEYRKKAQDFDDVQNQLEETIRLLKDELNAKDETIQSFEKEVRELKKFEQFAEYKDKYEEVCSEYDKEKERLTKLFKLYEETEAECTSLKKEVNEWQNWFDMNEDLFNRLFASTDHLRKTMKTPMPEAKKESEKKEAEKKHKTKKRIRFKK
jgi:chromosome segregation ATPase